MTKHDVKKWVVCRPGDGVGHAVAQTNGSQSYTACEVNLRVGDKDTNGARGLAPPETDKIQREKIMLIKIQESYMETVSNGMDRWSHRKDGGHISRIRRGAGRKARKALVAIGFTEKEAEQAIKDAHDIMLLNRAGVDDELNHESLIFGGILQDELPRRCCRKCVQRLKEATATK